jgi:hypothetical protein
MEFIILDQLSDAKENENNTSARNQISMISAILNAAKFETICLMKWIVPNNVCSDEKCLAESRKYLQTISLCFIISCSLQVLTVDR